MLFGPIWAGGVPPLPLAATYVYIFDLQICAVLICAAAFVFDMTLLPSIAGRF
jgi:hypothetical protein